MTDANAAFGLPPATQTPDERIAELEALLRAKTADERIAELEAKLAVSEARVAALPPDDAADPREGTGPADAQGFPKEYVRLTVYRGQSPTDLAYVPVAIRGYALKITRGEEVIVPKVFATVLDQAVEEITTQAMGGLVTRPSHRFPFSVHGPATEEQYLAFQATMREQGKLAAAQRV